MIGSTFSDLVSRRPGETDVEVLKSANNARKACKEVVLARRSDNRFPRLVAITVKAAESGDHSSPRKEGSCS